MTRLTLVIADDLAAQAEAAGLLDAAAMEALLRRALRERAANERIDEALRRLDAVGEPPMDDAEVADAVAAARREHAGRR